MATVLIQVGIGVAILTGGNSRLGVAAVTRTEPPSIRTTHLVASSERWTVPTLGRVTARRWRWIAPVSRKLSRLRPFFLKRGKWTWGPGRLPARLSQNARIPRSRSRKASCGTHLLTSGHQGTPSGPFFQLFHSRCWLMAEGKGMVLSPARRASRAARSRSNPQL